MSWTCPKCERVIKNPNQWHNCIKQDIDTLFDNKVKDLVFVFDKLLSSIIDWDNVNVSATKNCIVFVNSQTFLIVRPMKKELDLKFYLDKPNDEFPIFRKNLYTQEIIDFIIELVNQGEKTKQQIMDDYRIPKTTLYKWISKYNRNGSQK